MTNSLSRRTALKAIAATTAALPQLTRAAQRSDEKVVSFPPELPGGKTAVTDTMEEFLKPLVSLKPGVTIAKTPPTVDFAYFPGQTYRGNPWSNWGDSTAVAGKYYTAIGDHLAPAGNSFVYESAAATGVFRKLLDLKALLNLPEGHYAPGKIHSRVDLGSDGWLYCSTHRGSTKATTDVNHYTGDWIVRCHPQTAAAEVIVRGPVAKHCIPGGTLDPERLIFYGCTAPGSGDEGTGVQFFAYDCKNRKLLYAGENGPSRYILFTCSTGRAYYVPGNGTSPLMRFDPATDKAPQKIDGEIGIRAATRETPQGIVYSVSQGQESRSPTTIYAFDVRTEKIEPLGPAAVGVNEYVAAISADPSGRYLYYVPGAHGGSDRDGSAIVQFAVKTRTRKVIAFLNPFYQERYGFVPKGTYGLAYDLAGDKLYITWNISRGSRAWETCGLTTIHIPAAERAV